VNDNACHGRQGLAKYCERCGTGLAIKRVEGKILSVCPACEHIVYLDPKVAAGVVFTLNGEIVLLKRGIEPAIGKWVFPGGYVDRGEPVPVGAAREVREETGLEVSVGDLVGVYSYPEVAVVLIVYSGIVTGGSLRGNFESLEVRSFEISNIPWDELAFPSTAAALQDWVRINGT
jgi:ADP-ribose pyrophosphatase YjhB (NUDIX family)